VALSKIDTAAIATDAIEAAQLKSDAIAVGDLPTGSIIQVTQGTIKTDNFSVTSATFTDSGLEVSITPTSTSSKILVQFTGCIRVYNTSGQNAYAYWRIYRKIGSGSYARLDLHQFTHRILDYGNSGAISDIPMHCQYLDDPSTTSAVSYKLYAYLGAGSALEMNPDGSDESYAFAMEVVG